MVLSKRGEKDIWKSLYQFPVVESEFPRSDEEIVGTLMPAPVASRMKKVTLSGPVRHQLTHRTIHARFIHVEVSSLPSYPPPEWMVVSLHNLEKYPVPRLIQRYLESVKF